MSFDLFQDKTVFSGDEVSIRAEETQVFHDVSSFLSVLGALTTYEPSLYHGLRFAINAASAWPSISLAIRSRGRLSLAAISRTFIT